MKHKNKFLKAREHFGSIAKTLEFLNKQEGFAGVDRSTLFRWEKAKDEELPPRAHLALQKIIESNSLEEGETTVRVANVLSLLSLPSYLLCNSKERMILQAKDKSILATEGQKQRTESLLERHFNVRPIVKDYLSGGLALQDLIKGNVDITTAGDILVSEVEGEIAANLCEISSCPFVAVTTKEKFFQLSDFKNATIGYPKHSAVAIWLKKLGEERGVKFNKFIPADSPKELASYLKDKKVDTVVCWDWWMEQITSNMKNLRHQRVYNIFGVHHVNIVVNKKTTTSKAVRAYLAGLDLVTSNLSEYLGLNSGIEKHLGIKKDAVRGYIRNFNFGIKDLNLATILEFWR